MRVATCPIWIHTHTYIYMYNPKPFLMNMLKEAVPKPCRRFSNMTLYQMLHRVGDRHPELTAVEVLEGWTWDPTEPGSLASGSAQESVVSDFATDLAKEFSDLATDLAKKFVFLCLSNFFMFLHVSLSVVCFLTYKPIFKY